METLELPRIGNRFDAIDLLERLIQEAMTNTEVNKNLVLGLEALKDVIVREAI